MKDRLKTDELIKFYGNLTSKSDKKLLPKVVKDENKCKKKLIDVKINFYKLLNLTEDVKYYNSHNVTDRTEDVKYYQSHNVTDRSIPNSIIIALKYLLTRPNFDIKSLNFNFRDSYLIYKTFLENSLVDLNLFDNILIFEAILFYTRFKCKGVCDFNTINDFFNDFNTTNKEIRRIKILNLIYKTNNIDFLVLFFKLINKNICNIETDNKELNIIICFLFNMKILDDRQQTKSLYDEIIEILKF